ncbi:MAG: hypothetical protein A3I66_00815 [Burkholderiales bacterium RIFCSPLOWO2_02_FULL_57_36]|nr:MAG: hypothetical protein A3I66_00815 [Burkholderiales bacterium RIFCSPLOWO2_02_FULL_57_36]
MKPRRKWTPLEEALLVDLYPDVPCFDIAALLERSYSSVYQAADRLNLAKSEAFWASERSGRIQRGKQLPAMKASQFKPGGEPWNKGAHYTAGGRSAETRFKKGFRPHTWQPIGTYRISGDGALERKVTDLPGANHVRWHPVSRLVWVAANGPVPDGFMVVFKPGCKTKVLAEITPDKLECITRAENARRNHPNSSNPELGKLIQLKGAITRQVNRISREHKERSAS